MVFSSTIFLFLFLPLVLAAHFALRGTSARNTLLLIASLAFYAWGEVFYLLVLLVSIGWNKYLGILIDRQKSRHWLALGVAGNLVLLGFYKYANFIVGNINALLETFGIPALDWRPVHLPLGISFFTFQAITYLVDIYRGDAHVQKRVREVALYISLFPQLIAGPIVRYQTIAAQLTHRHVSTADFAYGVRRFIIGLGKKVLLANYLGETADAAFATSTEFLSTQDAWIGVLCYTLQIYFDFSGYSDMAIGIGCMFGFRFPENFKHPYIACSIQEFWRRWHITLSVWFRDYLYIPLGGSRHGALKTYRNLLIVFVLCGFWHGASWTFLVWGLYHGVFLVAERAGLGALLDRAPRLLRHAYLLLVVMCGWVFFRADTLGQAADYLQVMAGFPGERSVESYMGIYYNPTLWVLLAVSILAATPVLPCLREWITPARVSYRPALALGDLALITVLLFALIAVAAGTYNPFIYFRF